MFVIVTLAGRMLGTSLKNAWFYTLSRVSYQYALLRVSRFCMYHSITLEFSYIIYIAPKELPGGLLHLGCLNTVKGSKYPSTVCSTHLLMEKQVILKKKQE